MIYVLALTIGVVAGLRAVMAPAAVSWAAYLTSGLDLSGSWLAFLGFRWTPLIISVAALAELVTDQLPTTPSRKVPAQFGARLVMGAVSGAAIGTPSGAWIAGLVLGVVGAVVGTTEGAGLQFGEFDAHFRFRKRMRDAAKPGSRREPGMRACERVGVRTTLTQTKREIL